MKTIHRLLIIVGFAIAFGLLLASLSTVVAQQGTSVFQPNITEFRDDFESYALGENPTAIYDYRSFSVWSPPGDVWPDRFQVGQIGANKVLQYSYDGPSNHAPAIMKLYKQRFTALERVGATFYRTAQSMGWNDVVFEYQDDLHYYVAGYSWTNTLFLWAESVGMLAQVELWPDVNIGEVDNRIEVQRQGEKLVATITRLDTQESKSIEAIATHYAGGQAGIRSHEDWSGGLYLNVDDFYVKGSMSGSITPTPPPPAPTSFFDDFSAPTLDPAWQTVAFTGTRGHGYTSPANHISLTDNPGHLRYYLDPMTYERGFHNNYQTMFWTYPYDPGLELHRLFNGDQWVFESKADYYLPYTNGRFESTRIYFGDGGIGTLAVVFTRYRDSGYSAKVLSRNNFPLRPVSDRAGHGQRPARARK